MIGRVLEASEHFVHDDFLDITNGVVFDDTVYPELFDLLKVPNFSNMVLQQEINNPDPSPQDYFGRAVSIYGDTLVVGADNDDAFSNSGAIYIYTKINNAWVLETSIENPVPDLNVFFGRAVGIYNNTIVVGAQRSNVVGSDTGSVYVYTRTGTTWTLEQSINNPAPAISDNFGSSVSIYSDTIVVGAANNDTGATDAGSIYVYTRAVTTWTLQQTIDNPTPLANDYFGIDISIYQDTIVVGASSDDTGLSGAGSAYVYIRTSTTWTLQQTINHPSPALYVHFGQTVAIYNDIIVIGAPDSDIGGNSAGSAYVYTRAGTTWTLQQTFNNPSPASNEFFGFNIDIFEDSLLIGAYGYGNISGIGNIGRAYMYTLIGATWVLVSTIENPNNSINSSFSRALGIHNGTAAIGAYQDDTLNTDTGLVYVYTPSLINTNRIEATATSNPDTKYFIKAK